MRRSLAGGREGAAILGVSCLLDSPCGEASIPARDGELGSGSMPCPGRGCPLAAHGGRPQAPGPPCPVSANGGFPGLTFRPFLRSMEGSLPRERQTL